MPVKSTVVTPQLPDAVFWDMDGTLVDTEHYWLAAEEKLVRSFGGDWSWQDGVQLVGSGLWNSARVLQDYGVRLGEDEIVAALTATVLSHLEREVPWRPGAVELLGVLREAGIKTALVTMSVRSLAEHVAGAIGFPAFDAMVTGDEVGEAKPHPGPYLTAADRLGVDPLRSVAIEDSIPGLTSATRAGMVTIGVPHTVALMPENGYHLLPTLTDFGLTELAELFNRPLHGPQGGVAIGTAHRADGYPS